MVLNVFPVILHFVSIVNQIMFAQLVSTLLNYLMQMAHNASVASKVVIIAIQTNNVLAAKTQQRNQA